MSRQDIEDVYPLSPAQEGMLFHTLHSPDQGVYLTQYTCVLRGLDVPLFLAAWQRVIDRHTILRTGFVWRSTTKPLQVVGRSAGLTVERRDWRGLSESVRAERLEEYLRADRTASFNPSRAPLTRLAVFQVGEDAHRLVWTFHHLILDGWCRGIVLAEVLTLYAALREGRQAEMESELGSVRPYRDYIAWLQSQDVAKAERYWREALRGVVAPTPLGIGRPAGAMTGQPDVHTSRPIELTEETTSALRALARQSRLTLNTIVQGAWGLLLGRYSGETEVVYGAVVSGRPADLDGVESMVGMFINTLPVRVRMDGSQALLPWLERLLQQQAEMRQYEYSPLVQVQRWSDLPQGLPLFESIFAFENFPQENALPGGLEFEDVRSIQRGNYPLAGSATPLARMLLRLYYACSRFDAATIGRALGHLKVLLEEMAAHPEARLSDLPLLSAGERRQVLEEWSTGSAPNLGSLCFHELFEAQVERTPDAAALAGRDGSMTYRELNARANRLARHLQRLGVGPEVRVALLLERSPEAVVSLLAVLKAGGAYVPLATGLPAARLGFLLADSGVAVLLTRRTLAATVPDLPVHKLDVEEQEEAAAHESAADLESGVTPANLAYVIYTSGSTGQPKGGAVEHRQLTHYLAAVAERLDLPPAARYASVSSLAADLGHTTLFSPLWTGGCLHLLSEDEATDGDALGEEIQRRRIDCLKIVPSHLAALLTCSRPERLLPARRLVLGGEASSWAFVDRLQELAPDCVLFNHYGPTEATVGVTTYRVQEAGEGHREAGALPLGRPLGADRLYLVDVHGQLAGIGAPAEIQLAGTGLARGYLGRPDLTAERFLPDPFGAEPGGRVYRTGDLGRYLAHLADGTVEFLGRIDHQVKIRGFRVELREIEAALGRHPGVLQAAVVTRDDDAGGRRLAAYVVPHRQPSSGIPPLELAPDLTVHHLNKNETEHLYRQIFDSQIYLRHGIALEEGACIFDVGANIGLFTLFVHHVCERPRLFAFEPSPLAFEKLRSNADLYGLDVRLHECGLSNREGEASFTIYLRASVMSGLYADAAEEEQLFRDYLTAHRDEGGAEAETLHLHADELAAGRFERQVVQCRLRTISSLIREHGIERIDLLKVDAEKSEMDIFEGIEPSDWGKIQQVTAEVHDFEGRVARVVSLLAGHGFEVVTEQDSTLHDTGIHHVYARRSLPAGAARGKDRPWRSLVPVGAATVHGAEELRAFLAGELPDYMIPATFVLLDKLPLLPNGKLDRAALPEQESGPGEESGDSYLAPRNDVEERLARIWAEVLRVERVGVQDNFFQLGGDSILNIQIVARAHRAGLRLSPSQLFKYPTVAQLAAVIGDASPSSPNNAATAGPLTGEVPLTPIQAWFFERGVADPQHFNMPLLLELNRPVEPAVLAAALAHLLSHHDALRLGFERRGETWRQFHGAPGGPVPFAVVALQALSAAVSQAAFEDAASELQASFDLARPPLVRSALFQCGGGRPDLLLLAVHHLVVDGVSWRVLAEDLQALCLQLGRGGAADLPPKTTPFKVWAEKLSEHVRSGGFSAELSYWRALSAVAPLPTDGAEGDDRVTGARVVSAILDREETRALLQEVPAAYGTEVHEVLLCALVLAFRDWTRERRLIVDLEGHGREDLFQGVDLSRTVGWFTTHFPVLIELQADGGPGEDLKAVKEQLRQIPNRGLGYGALRYLGGGVEQLRAQSQPEVKFNYLGQLDTVLPADALFAPVWEGGGAARSPRGRRSHRLEVRGGITGGVLQMSWVYSHGLYRAETIEALAATFLSALRDLIAHCLAPESGGYTPSDFPDAALNQENLDAVLAQLGGQGEV